MKPEFKECLDHTLRHIDRHMVGFLGGPAQLQELSSWVPSNSGYSMIYHKIRMKNTASD